MRFLKYEVSEIRAVTVLYDNIFIIKKGSQVRIKQDGNNINTVNHLKYKIK